MTYLASRGAQLGCENFPCKAVPNFIPVADVGSRIPKSMQENFVLLGIRGHWNGQRDNRNVLALRESLEAEVGIQQRIDAQPLHEGPAYRGVRMNLNPVGGDHQPKFGAMLSDFVTHQQQQPFRDSPGLRPDFGVWRVVGHGIQTELAGVHKLLPPAGSTGCASEHAFRTAWIAHARLCLSGLRPSGDLKSGVVKELQQANAVHNIGHDVVPPDLLRLHIR